jgi:hypothetical protein
MVKLLEEGADAPQNSEEGSLKESQRFQELKHHSLQIQEVVELWARKFEVANARLIDIRKELVRGRSSHVQISAISGQTQPLREPIESELPLGLMEQESFESLSIYEIFSKPR